MLQFVFLSLTTYYFACHGDWVYQITQLCIAESSDWRQLFTWRWAVAEQTKFRPPQCCRKGRTALIFRSGTGGSTYDKLAIVNAAAPFRHLRRRVSSNSSQIAPIPSQSSDRPAHTSWPSATSLPYTLPYASRPKIALGRHVCRRSAVKRTSARKPQ